MSSWSLTAKRLPIRKSCPGSWPRPRWAKTVTVKVSRDGKGNRPPGEGRRDGGEGVEVSQAPASHKSLGITVQNVTPEIARELGLKKETGVVVTRVEAGKPGSRGRYSAGGCDSGSEPETGQGCRGFCPEDGEGQGAGKRPPLHPERTEQPICGRYTQVSGRASDRRLLFSHPSPRSNKNHFDRLSLIPDMLLNFARYIEANQLGAME